MTTLSPERIALVKRLEQQAEYGRVPNDVIRIMREAADALSTPPPASGVTEEGFEAGLKAWAEIYTSEPESVIPALRAALEAASVAAESAAWRDKFHILYGAIHAALTKHGIPTMNGNDIVEWDERLERALASKPTAGVDWEARFNAHTKAVHDWLVELAATIGAVDDMADDGATTVEVIKTEIMRRAREDRERWHSQPIAAPDEALMRAIHTMRHAAPFIQDTRMSGASQRVYDLDCTAAEIYLGIIPAPAKKVE